jgi:tetratricopeptide (TPR) repeat protein
MSNLRKEVGMQQISLRYHIVFFLRILLLVCAGCFSFIDSKAQSSLEKADKAIEEKNYEEAISYYYDAGKADPGNSYIIASILECKFELGDYQGCIDLANKAIKADPSREGYFYCRGASYYSLGQPEVALQDINQGIKLSGHVSGLYLLRATIKFEIGDSEGALKDFNRAIQIDPQNTDAYQSRGALKRTLNDLRGALADFSMVAAINNQDYNAYYFKGVTEYLLDDYKNALSDLDKAISINDTIPDYYYFRGVAKGSMKDYQGGIADLSRAIEGKPNEIHFRYDRSDIEKKLKDFPGALRDASSAIKLDSIKKISNHDDVQSKFFDGILVIYRTDELYANRAGIRRGMEDFKRAAADYTEAINRNSKDSDYFFGRAYCKGELGLYREAIQDYLVCLRLNPDKIIGRLNLSELYLITGDFKKALEQSTIANKKAVYEDDYALSFFLICAARKLDNQTIEDVDRKLKKELARDFSISWSFKMMEDHLSTSTIAQDKRDYIKGLIKLFDSKKKSD